MRSRKAISEVEKSGWKFQIDGYNALHIKRWSHEINTAGMVTEYKYAADIISDTDVYNLYVVLDDIVPNAVIMGTNVIEIFLNGDACQASGWHIDKGFKAFSTNSFKKGCNTLTVNIRCEAWSGEPQPLKYGAVLLGRFGVQKDSNDWRIVPEPEFVKLDFWDQQGYPFYSGQARYSKKLKISEGGPFIFKLDDMKGTAQLRIDGKDMGSRLWPPFEWYVRDDISGKDVTVTIVATNTLANYLGDPCPSGPSGSLRIYSVVND